MGSGAVGRVGQGMRVIWGGKLVGWRRGRIGWRKVIGRSVREVRWGELEAKRVERSPRQGCAWLVAGAQPRRWLHSAPVPSSLWVRPAAGFDSRSQSSVTAVKPPVTPHRERSSCRSAASLRAGPATGGGVEGMVCCTYVAEIYCTTMDYSCM